MPSLSVILPVYNAEKSIGRAITSILNQTYLDLELIVVDDGSNDGTHAILAEVNDPRVNIFHQDNLGVATASNLAFEKSTADLVARMDADDFAHPTKFEKQIKSLNDHSLDVIGCKIQIRDKYGQCPPSMLRYQAWINEDTITANQISALRFVEFPLVNPTILARRKYFEIGFANNLLPEDYDLFLKAAEQGLKIGKVDKVLFDWTERNDRLTRTDPRYSNHAFDQCRKKHLLAGPLEALTTVDLWGAGKTGKRWMRWLQTSNIQVARLFDVSPRKIGKQIHGTIVQHPSDLHIQPVDSVQCQLNSESMPLKNLMLVAVGAKGARQLIQKHLEECGYELGRNIWFVA